MKKYLFVFLVILFVSGIAYSQQPTTTPHPVSVSQDYLEDSVKAFKEVIALRDENAKLLIEKNLSEQERASLEQINQGLNEYLAIKDKTIQANQELVKIYQNIIKIQNDLIDKLEKKLVKPKSLLDKIGEFLKNATYVLAGLGIGAAIL